ncbi:hypothetical protein E2C01_062025 [Portunus trituberculatus]|uniref:Uncharacterized protein n=1 Tax=Portunus trituberculatus TaxID=210409 RepID=A0A5B7HDF5_PORTR|nr:hypothetical protein [Portunus trituberculatus]
MVGGCGGRAVVVSAELVCRCTGVSLSPPTTRCSETPVPPKQQLQQPLQPAVSPTPACTPSTHQATVHTSKAEFMELISATPAASVTNRGRKFGCVYEVRGPSPLHSPHHSLLT